MAAGDGGPAEALAALVADGGTARAAVMPHGPIPLRVMPKPPQ
jgi:hypothetical protein